ncbi:MAG: lytic transglycosylase domain-containing protein [Alphaproteobacteria bacterium]
MSDSNSLALLKPSPRGFIRTLVFGTLVAAAAMMTQNSATHFKGPSAHRPMLRLIDATDVAPSAYDEESAMSSKQLLARWDSLITEASQRFHVPKAWIRAVMAHESGGRTMLGQDKPIVSRAGAVGLMQVLPATYEEMAEQHKLGDNPFNARDNIMAGTAYLRWLHKRYGFPKMFAAYNAGPGRVAQGGRWPAETRAYVGGITRSLKTASNADLVKLTRPDGAAVKIDVAKVTAVRPAQPGEYAKTVKTVLILGAHKRQGVREDVHVATAAIRSVGGFI